MTWPGTHGSCITQTVEGIRQRWPARVLTSAVAKTLAATDSTFTLAAPSGSAKANTLPSLSPVTSSVEAACRRRHGGVMVRRLLPSQPC